MVRIVSRGATRRRGADGTPVVLGYRFSLPELLSLLSSTRLGAYSRRSALRRELPAPSIPRPVGRWLHCAIDSEMGTQPGIAVPDTPIPNPDAVQEVGTDGWTLLVNPDTAGAMAVNQTGALIWKLVDGRRTAEEIIAAVRSRFPDAPDTVAEDVRALLTKLAEGGFVGREIPLAGAHL
jgi:hypothetical protein